MKDKQTYKSLACILKPKSQEDIIRDVNKLSQEEKNRKLIQTMIGTTEHKKEITKMLIDAGADVNRRESIYNRTALILVSRRGYKEVVQFLLDAGADINAKDYGGCTALMHASRNGHKNVVKILLDAGADFKIKNNSGYTPLMLVTQYGRHDIVSLLNKYGAKE